MKHLKDALAKRRLRGAGAGGVVGAVHAGRAGGVARGRAVGGPEGEVALGALERADKRRLRGARCVMCGSVAPCRWHEPPIYDRDIFGTATRV